MRKIDNIVMNSLSLFLLLFVTNTNSQELRGNFTQHTYIVPTDPPSVSELYVCPEDSSNKTRCLTLNELTDSLPGRYGMFESREEVVFLSGKHVVDAEGGYVYSGHASNLVLRGESKSVTIVCLNEFSFCFSQGRYVKVLNLTFVNCSMNSFRPIIYRRQMYCCHTLLFIELEGSMVIENVQIINDSGVAIAVYVKGDSTFIVPNPVQLIFKIIQRNFSASSLYIICPSNNY